MTSTRLFLIVVWLSVLSWNESMAFHCTSSLLARKFAYQRAGYINRVTQSAQQSVLSRLLAADIKGEVDPGVVEGTSLRIVRYPHPSLRATNTEITLEEVKDGSIAQLAKEMFLVMYAAEGVGLAAPQVGINKRLMVFNESGDRKKWLEEVIMVNPVIVERSEATEIGVEGCLSFPDMSGDVDREKWVKVEALNTRGKKIKRKYEGWTARIFQHEYDHLDGVVYIDRLDGEGRATVQPRLDELIKEFGQGGAL
jgi:peptide deformylase